MRTKVFLISIWLIIFLTRTAFSQSKAMVLQATPDEFQQCIDTCLQKFIFDVRDSADYKQAIIPESLWCPTKEILLSSTDTLDCNTPILIYCAYGNRGQTASQMLVDKGFTMVVHLQNGFNAWQKANKPVYQIKKRGRDE
ncbi:MAG: hypothetical protein CVU09_13985 [Bacteroidetes bacterium HGW-Bacteroidetes-4]|jgi:hydroxyacylglutathione hydrolase|nr:MAG: hypothetical protein CVU09_13985 [Bacteroidetes bacterium HGW-Bacteroidetes-4]